MSTPSRDVLSTGIVPGAPARRLGPYETAYDVRRGYDDTAGEREPERRVAPEAVLVGRRRER